MNNLEKFAQLKRAARAYYSNEPSELTDEQYDNLLEELKNDPEIGSNVVAFEQQYLGASGKIRHNIPMLSLQKANTIDAVEAYLKKIFDFTDTVFCEPKYDGVALDIAIEEDGYHLSTRGDGNTGEDVTALVKAIVIKNLPNSNLIGYHIRGELLMAKRDFNLANEVLKAQGKEPFTHPRNAVAGIIKAVSDGNEQYGFCDLTFCPYGSLKDGKYVDFPSDLHALYGEALATRFGALNWGAKHSVDEVIDTIWLFDSKRDVFAVPVDGIVIKPAYGIFDSCLEHFPNTLHHPTFQLAYKYADEQGTVKVKDIEWSMGKTGVLTPVIVFNKAVNLVGCNVQRCTGHNYHFLVENDVRIGANIKVKRANQVIPKLCSVIKDDDWKNCAELTAPKVCPFCGAKTVVDDVNVKCANSDCMEMKSERLAYGYSRNGLNIHGVTAALVKVMLGKGLIKDLIDIYRCNLDELEGAQVGKIKFGKKSVESLKNAVNASRSADLAHLLSALCIDGFGLGSCKKLMNEGALLDDILDGNIGAIDIAKLGFSDDRAAEISKELNGYAGILREAKKLRIGKSVVQQPAKLVVITGAADGFATRNDFEAWLDQTEQFKLAGSVTKKTYCLIGSKDSSKMRKAKQLGIKIYSTVAEFRKKRFLI